VAAVVGAVFEFYGPDLECFEDAPHLRVIVRDIENLPFTLARTWAIRSKSWRSKFSRYTLIT
jgi:hypothetical protein